MIKVKRIGHATFETPDLDRHVDYYRRVVGLVPVDREPRRACLASPLGQLAIVLEAGAMARCKRLAFEVGRDLDADALLRRLAEAGLEGSHCRDPLPGVSRLVSFADPKGTAIDLFSEWSFLDVPPPAAAGTAAQKLGHVAFFCPDPRGIADFYARTMGFRTSDWLGDFFVFMRCGVDHHTVNFLRDQRTTMQHIAFEMRNANDLAASCDLIGREGITILWGPLRHGPGHNMSVYHRNPDGHIVELFCELDRMADEELEYFEPRPWHRDRPQKPKVWDPETSRDGWGLPPSPEFLRDR
jgi:catechol 2,3-dioxygenase-like lactoylglutathione lyase family enzyme